ncbi:MAG TPA: glycosyltransferase family 39 protein [Steroidobacteraceae bacterium]|nr:glycosyltransferase family 39 protein [Steroidobacteraceae bacterium]
MNESGWSRREAGYFLLALGWLVLTLGVRPLTLPDEGRYVSAAWEMIVSGNWLYPTLDGLPFFHKPPLYYWITASSLAVFGNHEWAARLAAVVGAGVAAFTLYAFALRRATPFVARLCLLVLATTPIFFGGAQFSNLDMLVGGFISATTLLAAEAAMNAAEGRPYRARLAGAYACAALGVLAKGLMGAVLPGLAIVLWLAWSRRPALLLRLLWVPGLVLFAAISAPWFVAMQQRFPGFLHYFFVYQQFQRYAQAGFNNPQPFWFYIPVLFVGMLPWSLLIAGTVRGARAATPGGLGVRSLMWISAAVTIGFFSVPTSKMIGYVLAAVAPLAFLLADGAAHQAGDPATLTKKLRGFAIAGAVLCLAVLLVYLKVDDRSNKALCATIAAQRQPGEPIYFVNYQYFDMPFYLRLREPVPIFEDWQRFLSRAGGRGDDWRTALVDSADFDPARGRTLLLETARLPEVLCAHPVSWVIAKRSSVSRNEVLQRFPAVAYARDREVWRFVRTDLAAKGFCSQTPSGGSSGTSTPPPPPG